MGFLQKYTVDMFSERNYLFIIIYNYLTINSCDIDLMWYMYIKLLLSLTVHWWDMYITKNDLDIDQKQLLSINI